MSPDISVVIPTYNSSQSVRETISSVLAQSVQNIEILVVDDGSTDDTREQVEAIDDARVRYLYKTNGGPASARNHGLAQARGDFIAFLDHDDLWPPDFLEVMRSHLEQRPEFGVAYGPITVRWDDGKEVRSYKRPPGASGRLAHALFKHGFVWTSASLMRASALRDFTYDESLRRSYEDGDFFLRLSSRTPFLFVPSVEAIKKTHESNYSSAVGVAPTRILVLERFLSRLGGDRIIPRRAARKKLSHECRSAARAYQGQAQRRAAMVLYRRALRYWPWDLRLYGGLLQAWRLDRRKDAAPDWSFPEPLPDIDRQDRTGGDHLSSEQQAGGRHE